VLAVNVCSLFFIRCLEESIFCDCIKFLEKNLDKPSALKAFIKFSLDNGKIYRGDTQKFGLFQ